MPVYNTGDPRVDQAFGNLASIFAPDPRREIAVRQAIADMHYKNAQRHKLEQEMLFENYLLGRRQKIGDQFGQALQGQYQNLSPDMAAVLAGTLGVRDGNVDQTATGLGTLASIAALLGGVQGEDAQRRAMALRGQMADVNTRMTTGYDQKVRGDDRSHDWRKHGATISATNARHAAGLRSAEQIAAADREAESLRHFYAPATLNPGQTRVGMLPGAEYSVTSPVPDPSTFKPGEGVATTGPDGVQIVREADPVAAAAAAGKVAPAPGSGPGASLEGEAARLGVPFIEGTGPGAADTNIINVVSAMVAGDEDVPRAWEIAYANALARVQNDGLVRVTNPDGSITFAQQQNTMPSAPTPDQVQASGQRQSAGPQQTGQMTTAGKPVYTDESGEQFSERTETIQLGDGRYYVVPTIDDSGNTIPNIEDYYRENGPVDPVTGETLPGFDSIAQADVYAMQRSDSLLPEQGQQALPEGMGPVPQGAVRGPAVIRAGDTVPAAGSGKGKIAVETARAGMLFSSFAGAINELMDLYNYDPETDRLGPGYRAAEGTLLANVLGVSDQVKHYIRGVGGDEEGQAYDRLQFQAVEPLLRFRSGAATPDAEVARYYSNLIPLPGSLEGEIKQRFRVLVREARAAESILNKYGLSLRDLSGLPEGDTRWLAAREEFNRASPMAGAYRSAPGQGQEWIKKHLPPDVAAQI